MIKEINVSVITKAVEELCAQVNFTLCDDVVCAITNAQKQEANETAKGILSEILENSKIADSEKIALCQDTGVVEVFVSLGQDVKIVGGSLTESINKAVANAYTQNYLRKSIVCDPFERKNTNDNTPASIYYDVVAGSELSITVLPKGAGTENASVLKMFAPTVPWEVIEKYIVDTVKENGVKSCPPLIVGVGIGGTFSKVAYIAKKALLRQIGSQNKNPVYAKKEKELLDKVNATNVGPMGLGGNTTAIAVHIETLPCHIASLPVAVSFSCHSLRRKTILL